jgi:hypothetical protein
MTDSARARHISDLIEESVYGPRGEETPPCANAWEVSKLIASLEARLEALEAIQPKPDEVTDEPHLKLQDCRLLGTGSGDAAHEGMIADQQAYVSRSYTDGVIVPRWFFT